MNETKTITWQDGSKPRLLREADTVAWFGGQYHQYKIEKGIWDHLEKLVNAGEIQFVDTYDGTPAGNAADPENITEYLDQVIGDTENHWLIEGHFFPDQIRMAIFLQEPLYEAFQRWSKEHPGAYAENFPHGQAPEYYFDDGKLRVRNAVFFQGCVVALNPWWENHDLKWGLHGQKARAVFFHPEVKYRLIQEKGGELCFELIPDKTGVYFVGASWNTNLLKK